MNTIFVQGVGNVPAVRACDLKRGDRIVLDGALYYTVVIIVPGRRYHIGARDHAGRLHVIERRMEQMVGLAV